MKALKVLGLVFLGLIIWTGMSYIGVAFLKAESNPFIWSQSARGGMMFSIFLYMAFSPLIAMFINDELKQLEK